MNTVRLLALLCVFAAGLTAAPPALFPLSEVRPGQRGVGRTVFQGEKVEEFQVEILGVLENLGPRQSIVLARLSGGPLERVGVMQGMSGSPVYVDGRLLGAVALAFPFSKEPIAGIRPIQQMLDGGGGTGPQPAPPAPVPAAPASTGDTPHLLDIATPLSFSGFTKATLDHFAPQLRTFGLEPRQALSGGGTPTTRSNDPRDLEPGSMISVQLVSGDLSIGADGTVTHVDGKRVYAFGHQFMNLGATELPFARASVLTLLPNLSTSFKISTAREWMGAITQDGTAAVAGEVGRRPALVPVRIAVNGPAQRSLGAPQRYEMQMVRDPVLTPFLLQMALYSTIESTQRSVGGSSYRLRGRIDFEGEAPPLVVDNVFSGDYNVPLQVALAPTVPLGYVLQSDVAKLRVREIALQIDVAQERRQARIDDAYTSRREVRPGDTVDIHVALAADGGRETAVQTRYRVPVGAPAGALYMTVSDANTANMADYGQIVSSTPRTASQLIGQANQLRPGNRVYVRVWRAEPSYPLPGGLLADPPPSLALLLGKATPGTAGAAAQNAKVAELVIDAGDLVVTGAKTLRVDIKE